MGLGLGLGWGFGWKEKIVVNMSWLECENKLKSQKST